MKIVYLPYGPNRFWRAQLARIGHRGIWATRLIGRLYWIEPASRVYFKNPNDLGA